MRRLRGHHVFCALLFQGVGYSPSFTARMEEAAASLARGEAFALCQGPDCLCAACPHLGEGGSCALGTGDVLGRDRAALAALGLAPGQIIPPGEAAGKLRQVSWEQWRSVCGGCRWAGEGLCSWGLFQEARQRGFV